MDKFDMKLETVRGTAVNEFEIKIPAGLPEGATLVVVTSISGDEIEARIKEVLRRHLDFMR